MASLGEILAKLAIGFGQGAQHQYATETRGADYLRKEEEALNASRARGVAEGGALQQRMLREAAIQAAAQEARTRGVSPPGADDVTASAALDESRTSAKEAADLEKSGAMAALADARAAGMSGPEERAALERLRTEGALKVQGARGNALVEAAQLRSAGRAPRRPRMGWIAGPGGTAIQGDLDAPGVERAPLSTPAGEQRKRADAGGLIAAYEAMADIPDEFIGPTKAFGAKMRGGMFAELAGVDPASEDYQAASALVGMPRDNLVQAITGAAAQVPEMKRLEQHIPDLTKQRAPAFRANVKITLAGLKIIEGLNKGTMSPEEASAQLRGLLGGGPAAPRTAAPAASVRRLKFNPATGLLE